MAVSGLVWPKEKTTTTTSKTWLGGPRANLFWGCHEPINDARDGLAHILCGRDDEAAGQKEDSGEDVVQPEHRVIRLNVLELEVIL